MSKLVVSSSPHIRTKNETPRVMLDVIIALLPATVAGTLIFGYFGKFAYEIGGKNTNPYRGGFRSMVRVKLCRH